MNTNTNELISDFLLNVSESIKKNQIPFALLTANEDNTVNFGINPVVSDEDVLSVLEELVEQTKNKINTKLN
jgi:hypothetical protein